MAGYDEDGSVSSAAGHAAYAYRRDATVPAFPDDRPIVIFDGHCVLCSRFARFLLAHDQHARLRLTAAQTPLGQALLVHWGLDPVCFESNVLLESGLPHFKSDGSIRMFELLGWPWSMLRLARLAPPRLLDRLYDVVARNRLRWFGSHSVCFLAGAFKARSFPGMSGDYRILIVGGYGTFGGRLVELLEHETRLTLLVAGRSLQRAREYCTQRSKAQATLIATFFDRIETDDRTLSELRVDLVVDASGPFQDYGRERYSLIERCIRCRVNYLDLADGSEFVSGVAAFDQAARRADIYVLSGVSSFPVLTAAVVRSLSADLDSVTSIRGGIAPSPFAGVGLNVIRAIASYAGQPITLKRAGQRVSGYPLTESIRFVIAVPGHIPLKKIRFSLVDVPDLQALAEIWPHTDDIWMGAGPVPSVLHWLLTAFAWLVRLRLIPSLSGLSSVIYFVTNHIRWGEHRGGMFLEVRGLASNGASVTREWHLLAEGEDGPLIPSMAVEALVRKSLAGQAPPSGARTAISDVTLADYQSLFARRTIYTGTRQREPSDSQTLFQQVLGGAFNRLPAPLGRLHSVTGRSLYAGQCTVRRSRNPVARLVAALIGFPKAGSDVAVTVELEADSSCEQWRRSIGARSFSSRLTLADGRSEGLIRERFGAIAIDMALVVEAMRLSYVIRRWSLFGMHMPLCIGPSTKAFELVDASGRFNFDVELRHPLLGLLVHYAGWLAPSSDALP